ncbi:hypothetical protein SAMN04488047_105192 [Tranquillimonas alkanivorans]|uniref:GmrSD restriction endonucleases N-terminal domain-containing protein n=2 Tax=Tranquillimonas alkanivorans TaxID=441119 RepID=A0A1I5PPJ0_9RHOB|nr:hypothetical protein SAMN04488047_105192 [Tranquillimonas alkanivorans]
MTPTKYVLDGQQRITVIYSALGAAAAETGFSPIYDLRKEEFATEPENREKHHFPLRFAYRTTDLLNFRTELQRLEDSGELQERLDSLIGAVTGYRIPVVELRDLSVEEVCPIFERINSSGTRLSTFDLVAAATWSQTFDLADHAQTISDELKPKGFAGITNETILKCISAQLISSVKKEDVLKLREQEEGKIESATSETKEALRKTIDYLQKDFGIQAMSFMPYDAHMICMRKIFSEEKNLTAVQNRRLRQWFWRTAFSQHFRGASEAFVTSSIGSAIAWILRGEGAADHFGQAPKADAIRSTKFHFRAAIAKAFVIALAKSGPRNITNGAAVDLVDALSTYNNKQYHHIYPQAWLKAEKITNIDSLSNICMLSASQNNKVSDTPPHEYLPAAINELASEAEGVFASNLMPSPEVTDYSTLTYDDFLAARSEEIARHVESLCNGDL